MRYLPWYEGGSWLTNFSHDELPLYEAALELTGDPRFIICSEPSGTPYCTQESLKESGMHSLHMTSPGEGASHFWRNFEAIQSLKP